MAEVTSLIEVRTSLSCELLEDEFARILAARRSLGVFGLASRSCEYRQPRYGVRWLNEERADPHGDEEEEVAPDELLSLLVDQRVNKGGQGRVDDPEPTPPMLVRSGEFRRAAELAVEYADPKLDSEVVLELRPGQWC